MDPFVARTAIDKNYPSRLRELQRPPDYVEAIGPLAHALDRLPHPIAIVGTRRATPVGMLYTRWFASVVASRGMTVVSGGAYGIDTGAHVGALEGGGRTVVVLPTGIDVKPDDGRDQLFDFVAASGAIVALQLHGTQGTRATNFLRNSVIAALSDDVFVIEAPVESGARNTGRSARELGRRYWCVPGSPFHAPSAGNALELLLGARPMSNPAEVLKHHALDFEKIPPFCRYVPGSSDPAIAPFGVLAASNQPVSSLPKSLAKPRPVASRTVPPPFVASTPEERRVVEALQKGALSIDELVLETALGVGALRAVLLTWTVDGVVREGPAGRFKLVTH
jgi:DNA processing protein